jgi:ABC-2 type transport system ATP-binding protein
MNQKSITVQDLHKSYGDTAAVAGVSFEVASGEVFGLLGPNGAGKTTTVECLLGLREPDSGNITVLGMEHDTDAREIKERIGAQLQTTGLYPKLTVRELIDLFGSLFPRAHSTESVVEMVGLQEKARTLSKNLSGGQRQRLAVALALVNDPDLIFLDEPTTGLDPQARRGLWDVIRGLQAAGKTVLLTTHYMEEAEQLCDRVAVVDHGRIIALDTPEALINHHFRETAIEFVAVGEPPREALTALPGVTHTLFENGRPTLYSTDVPRTMAGLFDLVTAEELAFKDMTVRQATLEDVFLKLTGRRIRA